MKIISRNGLSDDIQVLDNEGNSLLENLDVTEINIIVKPSQKVKVVLDCTVNQMNIEATDIEINKIVKG